MIRCRLCVLRGIGLELRLAASAAEQDFLALVRQAMGRIGLRDHAANRIAFRLGVGGMIVMMIVLVHGRVRGEFPRS